MSNFTSPDQQVPNTYDAASFQKIIRTLSNQINLLTQLVGPGAGTTTTVFHGNASGNGAFSGVDLTADVINSLPVGSLSGVLPYANGGTNTSTGSGGSWTPTDTSGAGLTFTLGTCSYIKLGMMVFAEFDITWPATLNASGVQIGGLPATSAADGNTWPVLISITTSGNTITGRVLNSSTNFVFDTTGGVPFTNTQFTGQTLKGCVIYRAAT